MRKLLTISLLLISFAVNAQVFQWQPSVDIENAQIPINLGGKVYKATGTSSSSDWTLVN